MGLVMGPKPESLWWECSCAKECEVDMNTKGMDKIFYPSVCGGICDSGPRSGEE